MQFFCAIILDEEVRVEFDYSLFQVLSFQSLWWQDVIINNDNSMFNSNTGSVIEGLPKLQYFDQEKL